MKRAKLFRQKEVVNEVLSSFKTNILRLLVLNQITRRQMIKFIDKKIRKTILENKDCPQKVRKTNILWVEILFLL